MTFLLTFIFALNILFYHIIFLGRLFATHRKKQAFRGSAIAPFLRNSPATDGGGFEQYRVFVQNSQSIFVHGCTEIDGAPLQSLSH